MTEMNQCMGELSSGTQDALLHRAIKGIYICIHPQLQWNASVASLEEKIFSALESKMTLWTWEAPRSRGGCGREF